MATIADIFISRTDVGFRWTLWATTGTERSGDGGSETEAVWRAVDALRDADGTASGVVAIHSTDAMRVAHAPLWAVPEYRHLEWEDNSENIVPGAQ